MKTELGVIFLISDEQFMSITLNTSFVDNGNLKTERLDAKEVYHNNFV